MDHNQQIGDDRQPAEAVAGEVLAGLFSAAGRADPYPLYDRLRPFGAAVTTSDGMLLVSGYTAMAALLRDHRLVKAPERTLAADGYPDWQDRPALRLMFTSLLMLNPPAHTRLRRLVSGVFTGRRKDRRGRARRARRGTRFCRRIRFPAASQRDRGIARRPRQRPADVPGPGP